MTCSDTTAPALLRSSNRQSIGASVCTQPARMEYRPVTAVGAVVQFQILTLHQNSPSPCLNPATEREEGAPELTSAPRNNLTVTPATTGGNSRPMGAEQPPVSTNHNRQSTQAGTEARNTNI